jgi:putative nucleotidyltransferase with HDIG domain
LDTNFREMKKIIEKLYQHNSLAYKIVLFVATTFLLVYFFPKGGTFKYEFQKGKPWQYEDLLAPFDFAIQKSAAVIAAEEKSLEKNSPRYFSYDTQVVANVKEDMSERLKAVATDSLYYRALFDQASAIVTEIYKVGFVGAGSATRVEDPRQEVVLRKGTQIEMLPFERFVFSKDLFHLIQSKIPLETSDLFQSVLINVLTEVIRPNVSFDANFTEKALQDAIRSISYTTGKVSKNQSIISRGLIVEGENYEVLNSLRAEYSSQTRSQNSMYWIVFGHTLLVALALLMLMLFLRKERPEIFEDNSKVAFIFFNILLLFFLVAMTVKYQVDYLYVVPMSVLPIVLKAFFDARLGLFTHVLTVLLLGFVVPNSFEFVFLQIIAGIVTILTVSELYKRENLFISVGQITLIYMLTYFAFSVLQEGNAAQLKWNYFGHFALNGVLSFLSLFLIWVYEKVFGLVSDVTLLELSNTNSKLLRDLNEKAPGTFQHSMQVANLAEAAANEIGANSMLVRTGALYHDIGKMMNPVYFTENQSTGVNPHNDLPPKESAQIIIHHVQKGIELAKKYGLPDRIIDFIRTHHGSSLVYYFYQKEKEGSLEAIDKADFQYPGPIPFSKETAILMLSDAAEAASKSLKDPTAQTIDQLIDGIASKQMEAGQYRNADITLKEIERIKKVLKKKLKNIYHLRVQYPE